MAQWEYILCNRKPQATDNRWLSDNYYSLEELTDMFNNEHGTAFTSGKEGYLINRKSGESCYVKTLDGMCGIMVVHKTTIAPNSISSWMPFLNFLANKANYTKIMITNIQTSNTYIEWCKLGFKPIVEFRNKRTGNEVGVCVKDVE